ncbi:hypothetical protein H0H81_000441 [Sphagnurus paluster]|uniref:Uncharacterized protein n=1 Tax=Sphagnurus paluster TaxID=117069 RepID=A0A9P7GML8_9AGAR|nr:hypothetical protein H0H81_000441 [Sphagnurus paluster]
MPAIRKPLRERCNIKLYVKTAIPTSVDDEEYSATDDNLRTRGRGVRVPYKNPTAKKAPVLTYQPRLLPIDTPTTKGMYNMHRLVPYIYVGMHDGAHLPRSLVTNDGSLFTHIVKISHAAHANGHKPGHRDLQIDLARGLHCLGLVVPGDTSSDGKVYRKLTGADKGSLYAEDDESGARCKQVSLTEEQLLITRDFLALAVPYHAVAHPPPEDVDDGEFVYGMADSARVLVTAPRGPGAAADIMAVVACYLAFASEEPAETVSSYIRVEGEVPRVWREGLKGRETLRVVQKMARRE